MARTRPTINRAALAERRKQVKSEVGSRGDWFNPKDPGEYLLYLGWQAYEQDPWPFVEVWVHYGLKGVPLTTCLDLEKNDVLTDDRVHGFLKNGEEDVQGGCPGCEFRETLTDPEKKRDVGRKRRFPMNVILMGKRDDVSSEWDMVAKGDLKVQPFSPGYGVWSDITDIILNEGDICDPDAAVLIRLVRSGKGKNSTEYTVTAQSESIRKPVKLPSSVQDLLDEALNKGEAGDLYRRIAVDMHRTRKSVEDAMAGKKVKTQDSSGDDDGKPPKCFRMDYTDDDDCGACPWRKPCSDHLASRGEGPYGDDGPLKPGDMFDGHLPLEEGDKGYGGDDGGSDDDVTETDEERTAREAAEKKATAAAKRKATRERKKAEAAAKAEAERLAAEAAASGSEADEDDEDTDEILEGLGYDSGQLDRMTDDTAFYLVDHAIPAAACSVGKAGGHTVFPQKLPTDHALYEAPEPEPEPKRTRRRRRKPAAEASPEPAATGGEDDDDDPLGLDDLERDLKNAAKK